MKKPHTAPDRGHAPKEDDIRWARRCLHRVAIVLADLPGHFKTDMKAVAMTVDKSQLSVRRQMPVPLKREKFSRLSTASTGNCSHKEPRKRARAAIAG